MQKKKKSRGKYFTSSTGCKTHVADFAGRLFQRHKTSFLWLKKWMLPHHHEPQQSFRLFGNKILLCDNLEKATSTFTPPTEYLVPMALRHGRSRFWPGCNAAYNADICNTLSGAVTFKRILKMLPHWILKGCVIKKKKKRGKTNLTFFTLCVSPSM